KVNGSFPRSTGNTPCYYNYLMADRYTRFDPAGTPEDPHAHYIFDHPLPLPALVYDLTYSNFEYKNCTVKDSVLTSSDTLRVHVEIANTGKMDGKEVVQLYFRDVVSSVTTPIKQLKAFKKVSVKAGDQVKVLLEVPVSEFGLY